jgi:hypothetical protein
MVLMRQRGRKSEAATNTPSFSVDHGPSALHPPAHLTVKEAQLFRDVVANVPSSQFSPSDVYLLTTFSQITALLQDAVSAVRKDTQPQNLKALNDLAKTQSMLATKLRLTAQSRTNAISTARAHANHRPSVYDLMRPEDWQS